MTRATRFVAVLALVALVAGCASAPPPLAFRLGTAHRDLTYCRGERLDLFVPRHGRQLLAVAMYVHGGGMTSGDKADLSPIFLDALAGAGFAVASIDYRLAPGAHFPAQIVDVTCAIRYLRAKAARFGLDPSAVVAFGTSVGGQLVALAALTGTRSPWDTGPYRDEPDTLAGVVDLFGPANLTEGASGFTASGIEAVFGTDRRAVLLAASPVHYVAKGAPPILLVQGQDDVKVRPSQALELEADLRAAHDPVQLLLVAHMGHMFARVGASPIAPSIGGIAARTVRFFDQVLRGARGAHR